MAMHPAMAAALESGVVCLAYMLKVTLPDHTIRLVDASAVVAWDGEVFTGEDETFGKLAGLGDFVEGTATEAPRQSVYLLPASNEAVARLTSPDVQGAPAYIWATVVNPQTGHVVGAPDLRFAGVLDDAEWAAGQNGRTLELGLCTVWERLFDEGEGQRWTDSFWTGVYGSGARAFQHTPKVNQKTYWGYKGPASSGGGVSVGGGGGDLGHSDNVVRSLV